MEILVSVVLERVVSFQYGQERVGFQVGAKYRKTSTLWMLEQMSCGQANEM